LSVSEPPVDKAAGTEDLQFFDLELVYAGAERSMKTTTTTMTTASRAAGRVAVRIGKGPLVDGGLRANGRRHPATRPPRCSDGHGADPEPPFVYRAPSSAHSQLHDVAPLSSISRPASAVE
jgi:hypothetical protein